SRRRRRVRRGSQRNAARGCRSRKTSARSCRRAGRWKLRKDEPWKNLKRRILRKEIKTARKLRTRKRGGNFLPVSASNSDIAQLLVQLPGNVPAGLVQHRGH